jgi:hypothetical protein
MTARITRRGLMKVTLGGAVAAVAGVTRSQAQEACLDGSMNEGLATALNFTEQAAKPEERCGSCGLYDGGAAACGHCQIFICNVPSTGHCDSWSPKA